MEAVLWEMLQAVGRFFLHPALYLFLFACLWFGISRVKRERRDFHTRINDVVSDLLSPLGVAFVTGLILTVVFVVVGVTIPFAMFLLMTVVWVFFLPFKNARLLSFSFTGSIAYLLTMVFPSSGSGWGWLDQQLTVISAMEGIHVAWFLGSIFFAEALLILVNGRKGSGPKLEKSKRGKTVGAHEVNRLWLVPSILLLPAGGLAVSEMGIWPFGQTAIGMSLETAGLMFVPVILGFRAVVRSGYPEDIYRRLGSKLLIVASIALITTIAGVFVNVLASVVPLIILVGRELIFFIHHKRESKSQSMFRSAKEGLVVLGVIPRSVGDEMGIKVGEKVMKVNGQPVSTQMELYEALQKKGAFCKLQVLDEQGELRFTQSSVYEDDHYQLGLQFVPDDDIGNLSTEGLRYTFLLQQDREKIHQAGTEEHEHETEAAATKERE
ncbi:PDZ domain-containing protein [Alteribacter aurantiacus]|uniref:PDZ domain-containing protein n=1 Tax=Alteribacter aurantiacus TaxID=254410 RepID=UPI000426A809|nr:PDZ domain-containing protein [Alteribacter aurantiacus]